MRVRITQAGMRLVVVGKAECGCFTPEVITLLRLLLRRAGAATPRAANALLILGD